MISVNPATGLLVCGCCLCRHSYPVPGQNDAPHTLRRQYGRRIAVTDSVRGRGTSRRILLKTFFQGLIQSVVRLSGGHQNQSIGIKRLP